MREHVQHGERCSRPLGGRALAADETDDLVDGVARPGPRRIAGSSTAATRERPRSTRGGPRSPRGPRPVRPTAVSAAVRPPGLPQPTPATLWPKEPVGVRVLARGAVDDRCQGARSRLRRIVTGLGVATASAMAVVGLGLLAQIAERSVEPAADASRPPASSVVVTAQPGETVWEVAERVAPGRSGREVAALAERIVVENALSSARLGPGQVLRVPAG